MLKVYKYPLLIADEWTVPLPVGAQLLQYGFQDGKPVLWALVDPAETRTLTRRFRFAGTGHPIEAEREALHYLNTATVSNLVFHLFEVL